VGQSDGLARGCGVLSRKGQGDTHLGALVVEGLTAVLAGSAGVAESLHLDDVGVPLQSLGIQLLIASVHRSVADDRHREVPALTLTLECELGIGLGVAGALLETAPVLGVVSDLVEEFLPGVGAALEDGGLRVGVTHEDRGVLGFGDGCRHDRHEADHHEGSREAAQPLELHNLLLEIGSLAGQCVDVIQLCWFDLTAQFVRSQDETNTLGNLLLKM
jgi:hypothetical protein